MPNPRLKELADRLDEELAAGGARESLEEIHALLAGADGPVELAVAVKLLQACRDERRHPELIALGESIAATGQDHPTVLRYRAQGLIEEGELDEALETLSRASVDVEERLRAIGASDAASGVPTAPYERLALRVERAEIAGLRGRAFKQRYIDADPTSDDPRSPDAWRAEQAYREAYEAAPGENLWHGINLVAVRSHQHRRLRLSPGERDHTADRVAREILRTLDVLEGQGSLSVWDQATRAEALLALDRLDEAEEALDEYLAHPELTPFMVASTARQWREVWELSGTPAGDRLLEKLESARDRPTVAPPGPKETEEEEGVGERRFRPSTDDHRGHARAAGVARLGRTPYWGDGTGFLFDVGFVWPDFDPPVPVPLLLTNAHVCSNLERELTSPEGASIPVEEIKILFLDRLRGRENTMLLDFAEVVWSSPREELDATLLLFRSYPAAARPAKLSESELEVGMRATIVGHPLGGARFFSAARSIEAVDAKYLYYSTATEPGSSGSPVFDEDWRLIGLHRGHSGSGDNYGVRMDRIVERMRSDLLARWPDGPGFWM